jgi:hypothetical protein
MTTKYVCYFDSLGFEWIFNLTAHEKTKTFEYLKGNTKIDFPVPRHAILRAQANPQRFPEIWSFESDIDQLDLNSLSKENPQVLVDAIRSNGHCIFKTKREKEVIV